MLPKSTEPMVAPQFITLEDHDEDRRVGRPSWDRVDHRGHLSWGRREDRSSSDRVGRQARLSSDRREDRSSLDRVDRLGRLSSDRRVDRPSSGREGRPSSGREGFVDQDLEGRSERGRAWVRPRHHRLQTQHRSGGIQNRFP